MSINSPSNQHTPDDREQRFWDLYIESINNGQPNAKASALAVGYSEPHADNITLQGWFKGRIDRLKRKGMLSKAEAKLEKTLDYEVENSEGEINVPLLRVQADVAKHVTSTLGKDEGYSSRTELTQKDGKDLPSPIVSITRQDVSSDNSTG